MVDKAKFMKQDSEKESYKLPSFCGSHKTMLNQELTGKVKVDGFVVLKDEHGDYATEVSRLDNGLADSYRNADPEWRTNFLKTVLG